MDQSFQGLMQTAAKIKGSQMESMRRKFAGWAPYLQNTLFADDGARALREMPIAERLVAAKREKVQGNGLFKAKNYGAAYESYQKALGAFVYCFSTDDNWKKNGIRDEKLVLVNDRGEGEAQMAKVAAHVVSCYLNIAACMTHEKQFRDCIKACDDALAIDAENVKALYRRARARIGPASAGGLEYELALKDLKRAYAIAPTDNVIRKELAALSREMREQSSKDKEQFTGMFERGEVVDEHAEAKDEEQLKERRARAEQLAQQKQLERMEQVAAEFELSGREGEAREIRTAIAKARAQATRPAKQDFANPTPQMRKEAKERGIDLDDPAVVAALQQLQDQREFDVDQDAVNDASTPAPAGAGAGGASVQTTPTAPASMDDIDVDKLPRPLLQKLLTGVVPADKLEAMSVPELRTKVTEVLAEDKRRQANSKKRVAMIQYTAFALLGLFLIYRFYVLGVFAFFLGDTDAMSAPTQAPSSSGLDDEFDTEF